MLQKCNPSFVIRLISFALLSCIPGLYIPEILPLFVLPLIALTVISLSVFFEKAKFRYITSFVLALLFLFISYFLVQLLIGLLQSTTVNRYYLHFGLSFWIIGFLSIFCFLSTLLYIRSLKWKVFEPLIITALVCLLFWSQGNHTVTLFSHPIKASLFTFIFILLQLIQLVSISRFSIRSILPLLFFIPFLLITVFFIVRTYNALSVTNNGGLIQPTLFRFDFSPYLSLQNEIKMTDKLVLIVRTKQENVNTLLRRVYLSGWSAKKGFYELDAPGEKPQLKNVPPKFTEIEHPDFFLRSPAEQEYFIVNFDPNSLIAMDYPIEVTRYKLWNSAAFNGAYSVVSNSSGFIPFELFDSSAPSGNEEEGLTAEAVSFYTDIDTDNRILLGDLAKSLTKDIPGYYDKILMLTSYLRDGDFRYSLKPGIAPDGNQLTYFLFDSKKGYCTYFAFSLCLMLRSIGIPSRIAAGFFIQPDSGALDYYPIRANMAHAWVEVFFPHYGWITFDPTTTQIAAGEELLFNKVPGGDEFIQLLNEIIDKRNFLTNNTSESTTLDSTNSITRFIARMFFHIKNYFIAMTILLVFLILFSFFFYRYLVINYSKNPRKVILFVSKEMYKKLRRKGKRQTHLQSRSDFIHSLNDSEISVLFNLEQKARYAPECADEDARKAKDIYSKLRTQGKHRFYLFCLFLMLSNSILPHQLIAQETPQSPASLLLTQAEDAIANENWESAISILNNGINLFPENPAFHFTLGDLYFNKALYEPAYKEFSSAKTLGFPESILYSRLSDTAGFLNKDEEALVYLKEYLKSVPDDLFAWSNFGWLCYKTHRLDEGISVLLQITEKHGPDSNIYVGLGNLYTAAFNYIEAKKYYTLAIKMAEKRNQAYLTSIYYYNRSILEEVFYNFEEAYEDTTKSLEASARSSGYLMQGELELRRLNFNGAFTQYLKAFALDSTPLATLGLADTLIQAGYPEVAEKYLKTVKNKSDFSWISNYGTTIVQYTADLHRIEKDLYKFKIQVEKRKVIHNSSTLISRLYNICVFSVLQWYHEALYRIQNKDVAHRYEINEKEYNSINGQELYINSFYFLAFNEWKKIGAPYLKRAENIEVNYITAAKPSYIYEQALLKNSLILFDEAINSLNPVWERQYLSKALAERILLTSKQNSALVRKYTEQLFSINPAFFIVYNIPLPVSFSLTDSKNKQINIKEQKIRALLLRSGFSFDTKSAFTISIHATEKKVTMSLVDRNTKHTIYTQDFNNSTSSAQVMTSSINKFSTSIFKTDLGI